MLLVPEVSKWRHRKDSIFSKLVCCYSKKKKNQQQIVLTKTIKLQKNVKYKTTHKKKNYFGLLGQCVFISSYCVVLKQCSLAQIY